MAYAGINLENVKLSNRSSILKLLNDHGAMSRKDIAIELGLTPATVTLICTEMIASGILCERGEVEEQKRAGRKKVWIDINYQYKYVLSVSIEAGETCISVCDLKGRPSALKSIRTDTAQQPELFLKEVAGECKALLWEKGIAKEQILGLGISIPGPVRRVSGVSQHAYRIWNSSIAVKDIMQEYFSTLPVIVENNVKAFAEGELIFGTGKQHENLLFVKWGPGVGSAIIIDNKIYDSRNSKTAEIGHYIVEPDGLQCRCGRRGCLETHVATHAITEAVKTSFCENTMPVLYQMFNGDAARIEARNISEWITADDPGLQKVLDDIIERLARTVVNVITMMAPDMVIVYGFMFEHEQIEQRFLEYCTHYDPAYNGEYIVKSELGSKIGYIGPAAVVVNELFMGQEP